VWLPVVFGGEAGDELVHGVGRLFGVGFGFVAGFCDGRRLAKSLIGDIESGKRSFVKEVFLQCSESLRWGMI
jgi:hypothetical protein